MPFQSLVNVTQAPAVAGDFASLNPRHSALAPIGDGTLSGFIAGTGGVTVGLFVWAGSDGVTLTNAGSGAPLGFVAREMQALITVFLGEASLVVPAGLPLGSIFDGGDFWAKNTGSGAVTRGLKAFASNTTGAVQFAAAGATVSGYTETNFYAATPAAAGELVKITTVVV